MYSYTCTESKKFRITQYLYLNTCVHHLTLWHFITMRGKNAKYLYGLFDLGDLSDTTLPLDDISPSMAGSGTCKVSTQQNAKYSKMVKITFNFSRIHSDPETTMALIKFLKCHGVAWVFLQIGSRCTHSYTALSSN